MICDLSCFARPEYVYEYFFDIITGKLGWCSGYHVSFTRCRSWVRNPYRVYFWFPDSFCSSSSSLLRHFLHIYSTLLPICQRFPIIWFTLHWFPLTMCVLCAVCCVQCAVCSVLCVVCCVLCAVCCVQCAVCCVLCAVCCVLCVERRQLDFGSSV